MSSLAERSRAETEAKPILPEPSGYLASNFVDCRRRVKPSQIWVGCRIVSRFVDAPLENGAVLVCRKVSNCAEHVLAHFSRNVSRFAAGGRQVCLS